MSGTESSRVLMDLLSRFSTGSVQVDIDSTPFATLDAEARTLDLQIGPLLSHTGPVHAVAKAGGPVGLWKARGIPGELAKRGWRLTLFDGPRELAAVGRGTSALTGHVHASPAALWKLRKLL